MLTQEVEISEVRRLTQLIKDKYQYDFTNYALSSFKRRIQRMLEIFKLGGVDALIDRLERDNNFIHEFLVELTVNVTEMFRDPSFWKEMKDNVLPNLFSTHDSISIWHAGCSSGEEVYSMAILLKEMGLHNKAKLFATDIDNEIVKQAKSGIYKAKNMELNGKNYFKATGGSDLSKYYSEQSGIIQMDQSLMENTVFRVHDLVKGQIFGKFDLILCRNVMIYFNQNLQNDVLKKFHESMFKYGYLIIGSKESLIWCEVANKFIIVNNEEKIYKKIKE